MGVWYTIKSQVDISIIIASEWEKKKEIEKEIKEKERYKELHF